MLNLHRVADPASLSGTTWMNAAAWGRVGLASAGQVRRPSPSPRPPSYQWPRARPLAVAGPHRAMRGGAHATTINR